MRFYDTYFHVILFLFHIFVLRMFSFYNYILRIFIVIEHVNVIMLTLCCVFSAGLPYFVEFFKNIIDKKRDIGPCC